jgi:hypothetical protein
VEGGAGNLDGGAPFTSCGYTRAHCDARGMFSSDSAGIPTRSFGGIEFVPASIVVRSYGEKGSHLAAASGNEARYNDFVPLVYGTAWYEPPIIFARNDGNLTHMEVLLGMGAGARRPRACAPAPARAAAPPSVRRGSRGAVEPRPSRTRPSAPPRLAPRRGRSAWRRDRRSCLR